MPRKKKQTEQTATATPLPEGQFISLRPEYIRPMDINYSRFNACLLDPATQNTVDPSILELAEDIRRTNYKNITPIIIRKTEDGYYQLVAGSRRLRAFFVLRAERPDIEINCIIISSTEEDCFINWYENNSREPLSPMDKAHFINHLKTRPEGRMTGSEIAARIGMSDATVSLYHKLLSLPDDWQLMVHRGQRSYREALDFLRDRDRSSSGTSTPAPMPESDAISPISQLTTCAESGTVATDQPSEERVTVLNGRALLNEIKTEVTEAADTAFRFPRITKPFFEKFADVIQDEMSFSELVDLFENVVAELVNKRNK